MPDDARTLICDTLAYLKDPLFPKQVIFASAEECVLFQKRPESRKPLAATPKELPSFIKVAAAPPLKASVAPAPIPKIEKIEEAPLATQIVSSPIKKTLQKIAPQLKLVDQIPDDGEAKRIANAWKEKISDSEVVLLACDTNPDTLELLKSLAKAIDLNLAKSKVLAADRLEREKRWDLFLQKNELRLIIASEGMQKLPELMRFYKAVPASGQFFLENTPLLPLSHASLYKSLEHKALLWKTLCQMLKK